MIVATPSMLARSGRSWAGSQLSDSSRGFAKRLQWYLANQDWVENVRSGAYHQWIEANYAERVAR